MDQGIFQQVSIASTKVITSPFLLCIKKLWVNFLTTDLLVRKRKSLQIIF